MLNGRFTQELQQQQIQAWSVHERALKSYMFSNIQQVGIAGSALMNALIDFNMVKLFILGNTEEKAGLCDGHYSSAGGLWENSSSTGTVVSHHLSVISNTETPG